MKALNFIRGVVRKIAAAFRRVIRPLASGAAAVVLGFALTMEAAPKAAAVVLAGAAVMMVDLVAPSEAEAGRLHRLRRWHRHTWSPRPNPNLPKRSFLHDFARDTRQSVNRETARIAVCLDRDEGDYLDPRCAQLRDGLCKKYNFQCLGMNWKNCLNKDTEDYAEAQCVQLRRILCMDYGFQCPSSPGAGDFPDLRSQRSRQLSRGIPYYNRKLFQEESPREFLDPRSRMFRQQPRELPGGRNFYRSPEFPAGTRPE